jgi:putative endonuclease
MLFWVPCTLNFTIFANWNPWVFFRNKNTDPKSASGADRREVGAIGESLAVKALKKGGYRIVALNHRSKLGEIDIIAKDGDSLAFIEVKTRRTGRFGEPKMAVTPDKQRKISMVALDYLKETGQTNEKARFDVVAIRLFQGSPKIEIIKNAFDLAY